MSLTLKPSHVLAFLRDPVLAFHHFYDMDLDVHQRVMLRYMWFVPDVQVDSGIFQGKTIVGLGWAGLRCILLPSPRGYDPRIVAAFYQDMNSATSVFKENWEKFIEKCPRFRNELKRQQAGRPGYQPFGGGFRYVFRNGNSVIVPPVGLKEDAEKLASLRVHDGMVEEAKSIEKKSDALDNQMLSRINAPCWNPRHPLFTNHKVLMGHAEDPATHPAYKRHKEAKQAIWDGDQEKAIITSNFRDWTPKFVHLRKDKEIRTAKRTNSPAKFNQRYGGFWEYGTEDWYEPGILKRCRNVRAPILLKRHREDAVFALGQDTAGGGSRRSDWNAMVNWCGIPISSATRIKDTTGYYTAPDGQIWSISPVWAWQGKSKDGGQLSGIVHRGHQRFSFGRIVYDPGGGGLWMAKELWKPRQFFDGREHTVTGLCLPEDSGLYPGASPVLVKWGKGSVDLAHAWEEPRFLVSDDGIVEAIHRKALDLFTSQSILLPPSPEDMPRKIWDAMSREERDAVKWLDIMVKQLAAIKVQMTTRNGEEVEKTTRNGFKSFYATGKKDLAYAGLYGLAALLSLIHDPQFAAGAEEGDSVMAMG